MSDYSSRPETLKHINQVQENIELIIVELRKRAEQHDNTKLKPGEVEYFDIYTPKLAGCTYGSEEYKQFLKELKPALDHHYRMNRHHPEHFGNGIQGMDLIDIIEMLCDWYAATKRHNDGDIMKSIAINKERFGYSEELKAVFENTCRNIFQGERNMAKKVIISQPMAGKTEEQIRAERAEAIKKLEADGYDVVDTVFQDFTNQENIPLKYLAKSLEAIADVDLVFFMAGWENARGCRIEHQCCADYGIEFQEA